MTAISASFATRLQLPIAWDRLESAPSAETREAAGWTNAGVFRYLLHEIDTEAALRPADERLTEALAPVRAKLDLLVEMVGRLSYRQLDLPPLRQIELTSARIAWHAPEPEPIGMWLRVRLYFHPVLLEPVVLYAAVARCDGEGREGHRIQADLAEMPETAGESLARLVFFAQRRRLAEHAAAGIAR